MTVLAKGSSLVASGTRVSNKRLFQSLVGKAKVPLAEHAYDYHAMLIKDGRRQAWQNFKFRLGLDPRVPKSQRKSVVVLGTGWGAMNFIRRLDVSLYDVTVVSPRDFFAFTPLLPSVCGGTLSPRACTEDVYPITKRGGKPVMDYRKARAVGVDITKKEVLCEAQPGTTFEVPYDYLVVAVGAEANTFGTPGVAEHAYFLKEVEDAQRVRHKIASNFEQAARPGTEESLKRRLLHFVMVGGGPTGVETAAEVADFLREDAGKRYPDLVKHAKISLVEMLPKVLPMFDLSVSDFTKQNLERQGVELLLESRVVKMTPESIFIEDREKVKKEFPCGFVLWASGVGQVPLTKRLLGTIEQQKSNRVLRIDENLRVKGGGSYVYGLGDCTMFTPEPLAHHADWLYDIAVSSPTGAGTTWLTSNQACLESRFAQLFPPPAVMNEPRDHLSREAFTALLIEIDSSYRPPPPTAQTANQEGLYLASIFNRYITEEDKATAPAYVYRWKGSMAYVGRGQSVIQIPGRTLLGGFTAHFIWRLFYWSQLMSPATKFVCLFDWIKTFVAGRNLGHKA